MRKDELITLHAFLIQIKNQMEEITGDHTSQFYTIYDELLVDPCSESTSLRKHLLAVFELTKAISSCLSDHGCISFEHIAQRFDKFNKRYWYSNEQIIHNTSIVKTKELINIFKYKGKNEKIIITTLFLIGHTDSITIQEVHNISSDYGTDESVVMIFHGPYLDKAFFRMWNTETSLIDGILSFKSVKINDFFNMFISFNWLNGWNKRAKYQ